MIEWGTARRACNHTWGVKLEGAAAGIYGHSYWLFVEGCHKGVDIVVSDHCVSCSWNNTLWSIIWASVLDTNIGVRSLLLNFACLQVTVRIAHVSSVATVVIETSRAVNDLLRREGIKSTVLDLVEGFKSGSRSECVAWTTVTLIFNTWYSTHLCPINRCVSYCRIWGSSWSIIFPSLSSARFRAFSWQICVWAVRVVILFFVFKQLLVFSFAHISKLVDSEFSSLVRFWIFSLNLFIVVIEVRLFLIILISGCVAFSILWVILSESLIYSCIISWFIFTLGAICAVVGLCIIFTWSWLLGGVCGVLLVFLEGKEPWRVSNTLWGVSVQIKDSSYGSDCDKQWYEFQSVFHMKWGFSQ